MKTKLVFLIKKTVCNFDKNLLVRCLKLYENNLEKLNTFHSTIFNMHIYLISFFFKCFSSLNHNIFAYKFPNAFVKTQFKTIRRIDKGSLRKDTRNTRLLLFNN